MFGRDHEALSIANKSQCVLSKKEFRMKAFINHVLFFVLMFSLATADAGENWINYHGKYFYDADSINCANDICSVWLKLSQSIEKASINKEAVSVKDTTYNVQLNCRGKLISNTVLVIHNLSDGTSEKQEYDLKWTKINKERDEKLFNLVCSNLLAMRK